MTLEAVNASGSDDSMTAFQLDLKVEPGPGASGILKFNTISTADANYVFDGMSLLGNPSYPVNDVTFEDFFDFVMPDSINEKQIPDGASFGLVTLDFDASYPGPPALPPQGYFEIYLGPFSGESGTWYFPIDGSGNEFFENAPAQAEWTLVGVIGINVTSEAAAVPEPTTLPLVYVAGAALLVSCRCCVARQVRQLFR